MDQALSVTILFKAPPINFTLTVEVDPREGGIVTSTPPGINCPTDCSEIYKSGTEVELTADPAAGFTFDGAGWSGDCDLVGTDFCDLTMTRNRTVTASFDRFISSQLFATEVVTDQLWIIDKQSGSGRAVGKIDVSDGAVGLACDENSNTLYGVDSPLGADSVLLKIEPNTGRTEKIGNIGFDAVKGLAFDSVSRILYGVTYLNEVLRIDPRTGEGILIGRPGTSFLDSLAYNPQQGVLYAVDINKDILYVIDPQKGTGNAVGPTGFINVSGLAYDRTTNTLYGAARGSGQLIEINTRTGSGQVVGRMPNTGFNGMTACLQ
jgi:DNA-binding beta-propeller fold protein YncE